MSNRNLAWPLDDPFGGKGELLVDEYEKRVWLHFNADEKRWEQVTEEWTAPTLDANQEERNDTSGERFGELRRVARMPMAWYFRNIAPARADGDVNYIRKVLNDPDFSKFRTFGGNI